MSHNKNDQFQPSFLEHQHETTTIREEEFHRLEVSNSIGQYLPANELRTSRRPESMNARTMFLERPFYLLNELLNQPCEEVEFRREPGKLKLKISNHNNLSQEQYFGRSHFKCVYDKLQYVKREGRSFTGKLKSVDTLIDYNWKMFRELEMRINLQDQCQQDRQDRFDSDFESGNLCKAYLKQSQPKEYYLLMENDINTHGYNNWFFYSFKNKERGITRFNIVNFVKNTAFFNQGMLISIYSLRKRSFEGTKWFKGGERITFSAINFVRNHHFTENYCCLSFQYNFEYENDEVYFALNQPYTYTRLINFIEQIKERPRDLEVESKGVGYTLSDNIIPMVRINLPGQNQQKHIILVLARQHPCETVGSFIAEAMMRCLTSLKSKAMDFLLNRYEFIFIPMVNPDGVIHGCSRCNMAGLDLNRQWRDDAMKELTPQTLKIKSFISNLLKSRKIKYLLDLHGHGKKLNSFFFACKGDEKEHYRLLSMAMNKIQPRFNIYDCTYGISKDKENTIRSKMYEMGAHSYTLENSLYGWRDENTIRHYAESDYSEIGKSLLEAIFTLQADQALVYQQLGLNRNTLSAELVTLNDKIEKQETINCQNKDILSESDPQGDRLNIEEILGNCKNALIKKKIKESYTQKPTEGKGKRKQKKPKAESSSKLEQKNLRDSCPSHLQRGNTDNPALYSEYLKSNLRKTDLTQNNTQKRASFSEKWKEKRKSIMQKKRNESRMIEVEQKVNLMRTNFKKSTPKPKLLDQHRADPIITKNMLTHALGKGKIYRSKVKTQFIESQQECSNISKDTIAENEVKKAEKQIKIKELKEDSLAMLLTDTLSILKLSKKSEKEPESEQNEKHRSSSVLKNQKSEKVHAKTETFCDESVWDTSKYRKFKQFMANGTYKKRLAKMQNSVFYYFPIL